MIVDAAAKIGIEVPIYCYHPALGPLGACRMCLVQVEKMPKLVTGCTTPVAEGMVVHTRGPAVDKGRQGILEFLLINHPLDCPVCDKGGECFLQDYTFRYGPPAGRFSESKLERAKDAPISDFILIDQERCVLCQRCVRFLGEYAGEPQLMLKGRGVETVVAPADDRPVTSPFSGNVIDLCPVGALTSAAYRFKARPWNQVRYPSVCPHCPVGCPVTVTAREEHVMRVEGRPIPDRDWGWLCDRGRFGYDFAVHPSRLLTARLEGRPVPEAAALRQVARWLGEVRDRYGAGAVGFVVGGQHTVEDAYHLRRFAETLVGPGVQLAISQRVRGYLPPWLHGTYDDLEAADAVILIGADPYRAVPVLHLKLRQHWRRKPALPRWGVGVRPLGRETLPLRDLVVRPQAMAATLAWALQRAAKDHPAARAVAAGLGAWEPEDPAAAEALGHVLVASERPLLVWDGHDPEVETVLRALASVRGDRPTPVLPGFGPENARGFEWAGFPGGYEALRRLLEQAASGAIRFLAVWGADLMREVPDAGLVEAALARVEYAVFEGLFPPQGGERFGVWLPGAAWAEEAGTWSTLEGRLSPVAEAVAPPGDARPVRSILAGLARALKRPWTPEAWDPMVGTEAGLLPRPQRPEAEDLPSIAAPPPWRLAGDQLYVVAEADVFAQGAPSEILAPRRPAFWGRVHPETWAAFGSGPSGGRLTLEREGRRWTVSVGPDPTVPRGLLFLPIGVAEAPVYQIGEGPVTVAQPLEVRGG